ncbi:MAG: hypothetical protein COT84_04070, partial [Chlamydiae bacterium CG10_big_fil_rev_8_21_14_0_10_35_9]
MLITFSSSKRISDVTQALEAAVKSHQFGVMQIHDLKKSMMKKGIEFERDCLIFEICQPEQAKKVLDQNMSISAALP